VLFSPLVHTVGLLISKIIFCFISGYLLYKVLVASGNSQNKTRQLWLLIVCNFGCQLFVHFSWLLKLVDKLLYPVAVTVLTKITFSVIRLSEVAFVLGTFAFMLFLEQLGHKTFTASLRHRLLGAAVLFFTCFMAIMAIGYFNHVTFGAFETVVRQCMVWYVLLSLVFSTLITWKRSQSPELPRIVGQQIKSLITYILAPQIVIVFIFARPLLFATTLPMPVNTSTNIYFFVFFIDVFNAAMMFFCARTILRLRFLNTKKQVEAPPVNNYEFTHQLKKALSQLDHTTSARELEDISRLFFARIFKLKYEDIALYIRPRSEAPDTGYHHTLPTMEAWLTAPQYEHLRNSLARSREILIRDELAFDYFHDRLTQQQQLLELLDRVGADVIAPVYEQQTITAYIVIKQNARPSQLFSDVERDEMSIFATHLSMLVYSLQHRTFSELIRTERAWHEDVHNKQQTINHCKESFKTLLSTTGHRTTGVLQYRRRKLTWASETARRLFNIDKAASPETISQASELKHVAYDALSNNREREAIIHMSESQIVHCKIMPCPDTAQSIILAYEPTAADNFIIPFDRLNDMTSWEYALLLETTASGKLINQLIPSSGKEFLNFKIELLKLSLSKKPTLIMVPEDDLRAVVHIIHHISLRTQLEIVHLTQPEQGSEIGMQLFGITPLSEHDVHEGLLAKLHKTGTLFIQNVEFLHKETQERLAACISTGLYQPLKTHTWQPCDIRIICSTSGHLERLVTEHKFSSTLYDILRTMTLTLPSLLQIPRHELVEFIHNISEQALQSKELRSLLEFTPKETATIIENASPSILGIKEQVHRALRIKSQRKHIDHLVKLEPLTASEFPPDIADAIRLGKKALKDKRIMQLLWETFRSQTKIATLLNVNRSSVNRRLKDYNLADI
jgi:hypothetical protein